MAGSKPGERRGGRKRGVPNKATLERQHRALEQLRERAKTTPVKRLSKDKLYELADVALGAVAMYQRAALKEDGTGKPGGTGYDPKMWTALGQWIELARRTLDSAADYESPKYRAIAVAAMPGDDLRQPAQSAPTIDNLPADEQGRERIANASYLKLVKG